MKSQTIVYFLKILINLCLCNFVVIGTFADSPKFYYSVANFLSANVLAIQMPSLLACFESYQIDEGEAGSVHC